MGGGKLSHRGGFGTSVPLTRPPVALPTLPRGAVSALGQAALFLSLFFPRCFSAGKFLLTRLQRVPRFSRSVWDSCRPSRFCVGVFTCHLRRPPAPGPRRPLPSLSVALNSRCRVSLADAARSLAAVTSGCPPAGHATPGKGTEADGPRWEALWHPVCVAVGGEASISSRGPVCVSPVALGVPGHPSLHGVRVRGSCGRDPVRQDPVCRGRVWGALWGLRAGLRLALSGRSCVPPQVLAERCPRGRQTGALGSVTDAGLSEKPLQSLREHQETPRLRCEDLLEQETSQGWACPRECHRGALSSQTCPRGDPATCHRSPGPLPGAEVRGVRLSVSGLGGSCSPGAFVLRWAEETPRLSAGSASPHGGGRAATGGAGAQTPRAGPPAAPGARWPRRLLLPSRRFAAFAKKVA